MVCVLVEFSTRDICIGGKMRKCDVCVGSYRL